MKLTHLRWITKTGSEQSFMTFYDQKWAVFSQVDPSAGTMAAWRTHAVPFWATAPLQWKTCLRRKARESFGTSWSSLFLEHHKFRFWQKNTSNHLNKFPFWFWGAKLRGERCGQSLHHYSKDADQKICCWQGIRIMIYTLIHRHPFLSSVLIDHESLPRYKPSEPCGSLRGRFEVLNWGQIQWCSHPEVLRHFHRFQRFTHIYTIQWFHSDP